MEFARDASAWSERASASPVALATCALALAVVTRWAIEFARASRERRAVDERERYELYRTQRARALERAEEELRRAANERAPGRLDREARDEATLAAKLAEIDAKAARLGLKAGRKLGGSSSSRPEWNPLAGGSESRGYRPARRTPPGGGG